MGRTPFGILVNHAIYNGLPSGRTKHEAIHLYEEAAIQYELLPYFIKLQHITSGSGLVPAYVKKGSHYVKQIVPIPPVIHNRSLFNHRRYLPRVKMLEEEGKVVFNYWNRYGKLHIYDILMQEQALRPHLPRTVPATIANAKEMMSMYDSLIIKPNIGSIGKGIVKLDKDGATWRLTYPLKTKGKRLKTIRFQSGFPPLLMQKLKSKAYILQQRLPLAKYHNNPFDLRVSVQKDHTGEWQVTGIVGKVAASNKFVTNVAQGGTVYPLPALLQHFPFLEYEQVKHDVEQFSLRVATYLCRFLPQLADIGLDIGITQFGFPVFIECNNRDLRYSFAKAHMGEEWKATYRNPVGYARYLLKQRS